MTRQTDALTRGSRLIQKMHKASDELVALLDGTASQADHAWITVSLVSFSNELAQRIEQAQKRFRSGDTAT